MFISMWGNAQDKIVLYPEGIPCNFSETANELVRIKKINHQIANPQLWYYPAVFSEKEVPAILVIPGGGYKNLAFEHEGIKVAKWLNQSGISAFVLMYRSPYWEPKPCKSKVALLDAQRAMRIIRQRSSQWNIEASKIGVMGFSAGGHLAASLSTQFDLGIPATENQFKKISSRPDFSILIYPVISMRKELTHMGSRKSLLGGDPTKDQIILYSNELQVKSDTPTTLLIHAMDDSVVIPENSMLYHKALQENKIPSTLHLMEQGGHGFGISSTNKPTKLWLALAKKWLIQRGIIAD
jgi:acetyl esterase/lipase